jgi:hypothetical protein
MVTAPASAPVIHLGSAHLSFDVGGVTLPGFSGGWDTPEITWDFGSLPNAVYLPLYVIAAALVFFAWLVGLYFAGAKWVAGPGKVLGDESA